MCCTMHLQVSEDANARLRASTEAHDRELRSNAERVHAEANRRIADVDNQVHV